MEGEPNPKTGPGSVHCEGPYKQKIRKKEKRRCGGRRGSCGIFGGGGGAWSQHPRTEVRVGGRFLTSSPPIWWRDDDVILVLDKHAIINQ